MANAGGKGAPEVAQGIRLKIAGQEIELTGKFAIAVVAGLLVILLLVLWADPNLRKTVTSLFTGNDVVVTNGGDDIGMRLPVACIGQDEEACALYCNRYPSVC